MNINIYDKIDGFTTRIVVDPKQGEYQGHIFLPEGHELWGVHVADIDIPVVGRWAISDMDENGDWFIGFVVHAPVHVDSMFVDDTTLFVSYMVRNEIRRIIRTREVGGPLWKRVLRAVFSR